MAHIIDRDKCSCCHQCAVNCPVEAIRIKDCKFWVDPEKCIDCGTCEDLCNNCAISLEGAVSEPAVPHETETVDCDLLVAGAGASGLIAAVLTAKQTGKKVLVLEKAKKIGGTSWYASGIRAFYSKIHEKLGFPDDREERIRNLMQELRDNGEDFSEELVRRSVWGGEKLVNLLVDECGCEKDLGVGKSPSGNPAMVFTDDYVSDYKRPDTSCGPGGFGSYVVNHMKNLADKYSVEIRTETQVDHILLDEAGNVCGAEAHDPGGQVHVTCRALVLATGTFSHDYELMKKVNPAIFRPGAPIHLYAAPTCTGDGIRMAEEIGGAIDYVNMKANNFGPVHHPFGFGLVSASWSGKAAMVNLNGVRYCAEDDFGSGKKFFDQPEQVAYAIMDHRAVMDAMDENIAQKRDGKYGVMIFQNVQQEIDRETLPGGPTKKGNTWAELAENMGVPVDAFVDQMERYNRYCETGVDEEFGRKRNLIPFHTPPYYAIYMGRFQENAMGGAKIGDDTGVLREDGSAIPGLYAVGDNCRGIQFQDDRSTHIMDKMVPAMTWAVTSGLIAGDAVSDYLGT